MLTNSSASLSAFLVAFVTCLLFFLQLRIADEFKDAEEDAEFRPYRAVPRGLVSLKELGCVFILSAMIQLSLAILYSPMLVVVLLIAWAYLALMSVEFFARDWLTARPITYLWTHMLIMPIVDFYATACHWLPTGEKPWQGLGFFLAASFCNGLVIEIGRKLRQPAGEENGVPTYSKLWGLKSASRVWLGCLVATALFATAAAWQIGFDLFVGLTLSALIIWVIPQVRNYSNTSQKRFELISGVWTLTLYLGLGLIPLLAR